MKPVELEIIMRDGTREGMQSASGNVDALSTMISDQKKLIVSLEQELNNLQKKIVQATNVGASNNDIASVNNLKVKIKELEESLIELEKQKKKGNDTPFIAPGTNEQFNKAKGRMDMLSFNVQQVARELPSLAMGPQMFFLAISNNIPMLMDQIKLASAEYKALTAAGQSATPVWKRVLGSILSWQTALVVGITLLVVYGKDIWNWTKSLFGAEEALIKVTSAQEAFNNARLKGDASAQSEITKLKLLYKTATDVTRSTNERKIAVDKLQELYPSYFKNLSDESIMAGNAALSYATLTTSILAAARARAKGSELDKMASQQWSLEMQRAGAAMEVESAKDWLNKQLRRNGGKKNQYVEDAQDDLAEKIRKYDKLTVAVNDSKKAQEQVAKGINIKDYTYDSKDAANEYKKGLSEEEKAKRKAEAEQRKKDREAAIAAGTENKTNSINEKQDLETIRFEQDTQFQIEQARIDAMKEGGEKTLEQMKLNHKKEMVELQRQKEDFLQKQIDKERAKFEADTKNKGKVFDSSSVKLTDGQESGFELLTKGTMSRQGTELADLYKKLLSDYQTYADKRLEVQQKYNEKRDVFEKIGASQGQKAELNRSEKKTLEDVDKEFASKSESFQVWMSEISNMSLDKLLSTLHEAENALVMSQITNHNADGSIKDTNQVATLRAKIKELTGKIQELQAKDKDKTGRTVKDWKDTEEVLSKVNGELKKIGENVGGAAGELISFAGDLSTNAISMVNSITQLSQMNSVAVQTTATGAARAIKTVEKASVILAIISAALQIIEKIKSVLSKDAEIQYEVEFQQKRLDLQLKYNQALVEQLAIQNDMFGGDKYSNALASVKAYYQALNNYDDQYQNATFTRIKKTNSWLKVASPLLGSSLQGTKISVVNARENMEIKTQAAKKGFLGIGGSHSKYQDLESWLKDNKYGDLFNSDGSLNLSLAKSVVEMDSLTDETKKYLQSLIDCQTTVNEMNEALKEYINDTFGDLGDSMTKAIVDAFKNGTDAAQTFKTDMITVLEDVGEQMVKSLFIQKYIDAYSEQLQDIYKKQRIGTDEQKATSIAEEVAKASADYFSSLTDAQQKSDEWLKMYQDMAAKYGFDLYNSTTSQTTQSGAITTISEETGSKLEGTMVALLNRAAGMDDKFGDISKVISSALAPLLQIAENTMGCKRIDEMADDIAKIIRDGITTKLK